MAERANNEGFHVLDEFVCDAIREPGIPQADPKKQGKNERIRVIEELVFGGRARPRKMAKRQSRFPPTWAASDCRKPLPPACGLSSTVRIRASRLRPRSARRRKGWSTWQSCLLRYGCGPSDGPHDIRLSDRIPRPQGRALWIVEPSTPLRKLAGSCRRSGGRTPVAGWRGPYTKNGRTSSNQRGNKWPQWPRPLPSSSQCL